MKKIHTCFALFILMSCSIKLTETASGLKYRILEKGSGPKAKVGDEILLYETTSYRNGTVLYSNYNSSSPVKVLIGGNQATQAVDEGLRGMRVGEVRELIATPNLVKRKGYPPNVSPDSTLVIKMKLAKILSKYEITNLNSYKHPAHLSELCKQKAVICF